MPRPNWGQPVEAPHLGLGDLAECIEGRVGEQIGRRLIMAE